MVSDYFNLWISVCPTTLKRICRQHGINRWPSRKVKKVGHSLQKLQVVMDSVQGASGSLQIGSFYKNFPKLASQNVSTTSPFCSLKPSNPQNPQSSQPESGNIRPLSNSSRSPSSTCSQSSTNSSLCCSTGKKLHSSSNNITDPEELAMWENSVNDHLKRAQSKVELNGSSQEGSRTKHTLGSQSLKILNDTSKPEAPPNVTFCSGDVSRELEPLRVKVTYGEEKIRFRLQKGWRLGDLWKEIQRRFRVEDPTRYNLKYLDDDSEWVLLTCDADLEECVKVSGSSEGNIIRLSIQASHHYLGSSVGSSGPL